MIDQHTILLRQRALWEWAYQEQRSDREWASPSRFAMEVAPVLPAAGRVLELGCGLGADAAFFARAGGHAVLATDFASAALARLRTRYGAEAGLDTARIDMRAPLPLADARADTVYAHLSLHYYPDAATRALFAEIRRVLRPGGVLAFACKSTDDPLYGRGDLVEPDMFALDGKVRHFFGEDYARDCLADGFEVEQFKHMSEALSSERSRVVRVLARRVDRRRA